MKRILFLILLAAGLITESIHAAHVDFFLKLQGVDGESTDDRHRSSIEISSFSWGITQQGIDTTAGGGGGAGKVVFQDIHFSTKISKASPKLMLACATGQHFPSVVFYVHRAGGDTQEYLTIKLTDVFISSYQTSGSLGTTGDSVPTDQFSINFTKIEFKYTPQKEEPVIGEATRPTVTQ